MSRGPLCPCGVLRTVKWPTYLPARPSLPSPQEPPAILKWLGLDPTTKLARTTPMRVGESFVRLCLPFADPWYTSPAAPHSA